MGQNEGLRDLDARYYPLENAMTLYFMINEPPV